MLIRIVLFLALTFFASPCFSDEFEDLYLGRDISWNLTPDDLLQNWTYDVYVLWLGKIKDVSILPLQNEKTEVSWLFSAHSFIQPGRQAVKEPFKVHEKNSGFFSFTIVFSRNIKQVDEEELKRYKEPYFTILVAKPLKITNLKGIQSILIEPQLLYMSDIYEVDFIK